MRPRNLARTVARIEVEVPVEVVKEVPVYHTRVQQSASRPSSVTVRKSPKRISSVTRVKKNEQANDFYIGGVKVDKEYDKTEEKLDFYPNNK